MCETHRQHRGQAISAFRILVHFLLKKRIKHLQIYFSHVYFKGDAGGLLQNWGTNRQEPFPHPRAPHPSPLDDLHVEGWELPSSEDKGLQGVWPEDGRQLSTVRPREQVAPRGRSGGRKTPVPLETSKARRFPLGSQRRPGHRLHWAVWLLRLLGSQVGRQRREALRGAQAKLGTLASLSCSWTF